MNLWIEVESKLPYALTLPPTTDVGRDASAHIIMSSFSLHSLRGDGGGEEITLVPDIGEAEAAVKRGYITEYPQQHKVRIRDITSILAQK